MLCAAASRSLAMLRSPMLCICFRPRASKCISSFTKPHSISMTCETSQFCSSLHFKCFHDIEPYKKKCQPSLIFKPFTIESTHVCHRYLTVTAEMDEWVCGKSWPSMHLLQKPSQPSLKFLSHQWRSYFYVTPYKFPGHHAACCWCSKTTSIIITKPFSWVHTA